MVQSTMNYQNTLYYPDDTRLHCPGRMLAIDFIVAFLFMPMSASAALRETQKLARIMEVDLLAVAPEAETYMPQHCLDGEPAPWRIARRVSAGKLTFLVKIAAMDLPSQLVAFRHIQAKRRQAGPVYNDACVRLAIKHNLMRPNPNVLLPPVGLYHDWFVVWAGFVKKYEMYSENAEQQHQNVVRCRYLAEEEARITAMLGGYDAALAMAQQVVDTIETNFTNAR